MKKAQTTYEEKDIAEIVNELLLRLETPEGAAFQSIQISPGTLMLKIRKEIFVINITSKNKLS